MQKKIKTITSLKKDDTLFFKQIEWGMGLENNTLYLSWDLDLDDLQTFIVKVECLLERNGKNKDINLVIMSNGGDAYAMLGMIDYFKALPINVNTHCVGMAMSAAAVILACGTGKRTITKYSTVMLHEGSSFGMGKRSDVITGAEHLKKLGDNVNEILGSVTKKDKKYWEKTLKTDTYLTADDALKLGLVDEVV